MESQTIYAEADEQKAEENANASYDIISFPSANLPESYHGLIYARWLRSHRYGNHLFKMIESDIYYEKYARYIDILMAKPEASIRLAVLTDDHDVVLGFCAHRNQILDYVHVHYACRGAKIATHLVPNKISCITHYTYRGARFVTNRYGGFKFNPYA